jgi:Na+/phosphate symporter
MSCLYITKQQKYSSTKIPLMAHLMLIFINSSHELFSFTYYLSKNQSNKRLNFDHLTFNIYLCLSAVFFTLH